jgi:hypothetical protein
MPKHRARIAGSHKWVKPSKALAFKALLHVRVRHFKPAV